MLLLLSCCVAACCTSVLLITIVNVFVSQPYMDEIFHVNQSAAYCAGDYQYWNRKITTPPGLYLASVAVMKPLVWLVGNANAASVCTARSLRYVNAICIGPLLFLIYTTLTKLRRKEHVVEEGGGRNEPIVCLISVNIVLFPLLTFFTLLHYTDTASLLCVLLMYCLYLHNLHVFSAICGFAACAMRQTNIVWAAFCAGLTIWDILQEFLDIFEKKKGRRTILGSISALNSMVREKPRLFYHMLVTMFSKVAAYAMLFLMFCVFAVVNGGLALGDKSAHQIVLHIPQFYYFLSFTCALGCPLLLNMYSCGLVRRNRMGLLICIVCMLLSVAYFTYDHPYLLADNRHYTFYIWKWWFRRGPLYKYVAVIIYALCLVFVANSLSLQSGVWKLGYFLCCVLVTVPNRLLELRYFIIPYVLWRMHCKHTIQTRNRLLAETALFVSINIFTIGMFLLKPFTWSHEPGTQRFMW